MLITIGGRRCPVELQAAGFLCAQAGRTARCPHLLMNQVFISPLSHTSPLAQVAPITMGKFLVSPAAVETSNGLFRASFCVERSPSKGAYCRIFNFDREFVSREAARVFAITQGWLETCAMRTPPMASA